MVKKLTITTIVFLLLLVIIGTRLTKEFDVEQSITIQAPVNNIHPYVNDLKQWLLWNPWNTDKASVKLFYGNVTQGVGATQSWQEDEEKGRLKITASSPTNGIAYDIYFDNSKIPFISAIEYHPVDKQLTKVTWRIHGDIDVPVIGGYIAMYFEYRTVDNYLKGLQNLKQLVETKPVVIQ